MTGIESLPHEIFMSVIDNLIDQTKYEPEAWIGDFYRLSLVSHDFHDAVEPQLYSSFQKCGASVTPFLRTVVEQPRLAQLVRKVVITIDESCFLERSLLADAMSEMRVRLHQAMVALGLDQKGFESWLEDSLKTNWDVREALLLCLLPNLKDLSMDVRTGRFPWLNMLFRFPCLTEKLLPSSATLESLSVLGLMPIRDVVRPFQSLCRLENLKTLMVPATIVLPRSTAHACPLPASLVRLRLEYDSLTDSELLFTELARLVEQKRLSSLQFLRVDGWGRVGLQNSAFQCLKVICREAGIYLNQI